MDTSTPNVSGANSRPSTPPIGKSSLTDKVGDAVAKGRSTLEDTAATARDDLGQEVSDLRRDMAKMQETMAKFASDAGGEAMKTAKSVGSAVAGEVGTTAQQVVDAGAKMADTATQQVKTLAMELEGMARRNPLGTIAGSVIVGVVLGMLRSKN